MTWLAALSALVAWWASTGAILFVIRRADRRGGDAHLMAVLGGLPLLALGIALILASLRDYSTAGVFTGFFGALAIWGWIELAFLAGVVAGPERRDCPPGLEGADRFWRAFGTLAHHELLLVLGLFLLTVASAGADNRMGLATYLVLFLARICAKLNLFFGVPRINLEFVPARLTHLKSYFRQGPLTLAFPAAITVLSALLTVCAMRLWQAGDQVTATGFALLTALSALALLEHWLMLLPVADAKLWRWMLPAPTTPTEERDTHGL